MKFLKRNIYSKLKWVEGLLPLCMAFIMSVGATSCRDDFGFSDSFNDDNFTGITLLIPNVELAAEYGATRSDGNANTRAYETAKEQNLNTLYIVAIDRSGNVNVSLKTTSNGSEGEYLKYRVNLANGEYKFYVVANLNRYLQTVGADGSSNSVTFADLATDETAIRDLILNFNAGRQLEPGFLPLACLSEDIKVGQNASSAARPSDPEGFISIPQGNTYVYADMQFLCSKVRYTILFDYDNEEVKKKFGSGDVIDIHRHLAQDYPYATNMRQATAMYIAKRDNVAQDFIQSSGDGNAEWPIFLDRYIYGEFDFYTANDPDKIRQELGKLKPWSNSDGEWNQGIFLKKRAWQGVTYLPENVQPETKTLDPTLLKFPYSFNGSTGAESPRTIKLDFENKKSSETGLRGLQRGKAYDVYVLIQNPDPEQWTLKVIPSDWTLQNLAYELHGPYELVVETAVLPELGMQEPAEFWYRSDIEPQDIGFETPYIDVKGELLPLFIGGVAQNPDGTYLKNENGDYIYRVRLNSKIPYSILSQLKNLNETDEGFTFYTANDRTKSAIARSKDDVSYFHIVAGSLHKRIEIEELNLEPYLEVTPQILIIDTRELFTSTSDTYNRNFHFETNVDLSEANVSLRLYDPDKLISEGKGVGTTVLQIIDENGYQGIDDVYNITDSEGEFTVSAKDIVLGNPYWNQNNEYTLIFTLTVPDGGEELTLEKTVTIKVRPFTGSYSIHFRDNTKPWESPHIYVYQDLTLPSDLGRGIDSYGVERDNSRFAGKIVGYIEDNNGLQWNAALQYVFSNNMSFKGWYGYGGPEINNPWNEATLTNTYPSDNNNSNNSTMGFVMFGQPSNEGGKYYWNYSYAYNVTGGINENPDRRARYNYDVNFNADHEKGFDNWGCGDCRGLSPDYNGNNDDHFFTGISMEREADGWWKYTLTGVAVPGRTMIIFADLHAPWSRGDYYAEDFRWPGDYESGLPLFDFEDNEGWFLFDGNTTNADQKFYDEKPVAQVVPHNFTSAYRTLRIEVKDLGTTNNVTLNGAAPISTGTSGNNVNWYEFNVNTTAQTVSVVVDSSKGRKTYVLYPKNFVRSGTRYVTAKPLYTEFTNDIEFFVKWNDHINSNGYDPGAGTNQLQIQTTNNQSLYNITFTGKEYGNYKYVIFKHQPGNNSLDVLRLRLNGSYSRDIKVEDLPQYYYPTQGNYLMNIHKLPN